MEEKFLARLMNLYVQFFGVVLCHLMHLSTMAPDGNFLGALEYLLRDSVAHHNSCVNRAGGEADAAPDDDDDD